MVSLITAADPVAPLENLLNPIIVAINEVADGAGRGGRAIYYAADLNALPSSGVLEGDLCHVDEGDFYMARLDSAWAQVTNARFANEAAANTAFNKASGAYKTGAIARMGSELFERRFLGTAWVAIEAMVPLVPTSVVGGTVAADGLVSFSGASTVSLNGIFNSSFIAFMIVTGPLALSGANYLNARLRAGGTDASAASYSFALNYNNGTTIAANNQAGVNTWTLHAATSVAQRVTLTFYGPAVAAATIMQAESITGTAPPTRSDGAFGHSLSTIYDGLTLYPSAGTFSGTLRIYGIS